MPKQSRTIVLSLLGLVLVLSFQNCSQNGMQFKEAASGSVLNQGSGDPDPADDTAYDPSEAPPFSCQQFRVITRGGLSSKRLDIPARDSEGTCYLIHLLDQVESIASLDGGFDKDTEVISRHHGVESSDGVLPLHSPFLMGKAQFSVRLQGVRKILLSGGSNDQSKILVDNFILVGIQREDAVNDYANQYLAYGTSDSSISLDLLRVSFLDTLIELLPFATGGTSTISPLALENKIGLNQYYRFDIRALDAGGTARMSNVYLLFQ